MHLRVASEARGVRLTAVLTACCCWTFGCARGPADVSVKWAIEPTPVSTRAVTLVRVELKQKDGTPIVGADLRVEAHMSHPGMDPVVADAIERGSGIYETRLSLSMPGQWVLVIAGTLADGRRIVEQTEVTAVQPSG